MAALEQIYLHSDLEPRDAAEAIAAAIGGDIRDADEAVYVGRDQVIGGDGAGGEVSVNYDAMGEPDPDDLPSASDGYRLVWQVYKYGIRDAEKQRQAARVLFDDLTTKLRWPILLVHNLQIAVADWNPDRGLREFPSETSVTAADVLTS